MCNGMSCSIVLLSTLFVFSTVVCTLQREKEREFISAELIPAEVTAAILSWKCHCIFVSADKGQPYDAVITVYSMPKCCGYIIIPNA